MSGDRDELERRWQQWLLERNRRGLRTMLWIGVSLYPLFGILDYLIAPHDWLWLLWGTRAVVTCVTLAMFVVVRTELFRRYPNTLTASLMVIGSGGISLMTVLLGGLESPYYAGLTLAIIGTGLLFVWPAVAVIVTYTVIVLTFVVPNLVVNEVDDAITAISNLFFLVSMAIISGTGQILHYRFQREQVANGLIMEQTKRNLEHAHAELQRLDRFKSEFFANITHELKTPLTMMLAPLELMIDDQLGSVTAPQRSTLLSIQKSGVKLLQLIGDLLDLTKLEESRLRLRVDDHDLVAHLGELVSQSRFLAQRKSLELHFEVEGDPGPICCDLERFERVAVNLLSNATKFTPPGGSVTVRVVDEPGSVRIDVEDTGIGFPPGEVERVFHRFYQVDMDARRRFGGAGIGLALAKELVELHGGQIWAESTAGKGATFHVRLKKGREHFATHALDRREQSVDVLDGQRASDFGVADWRVGDDDKFRLIDIDSATEQRVVDRDVDEELRPHSVLVVEDTPDVTRVIRLALHHEFMVLAASDGLKGLELARKHRPTVIITDLMMPELDGLELVRRLRADPATAPIPIIMLTARSEVEDRVAGLESGVNAYVGKPFSARELVSVVRSQLSAREATADAMLSGKMQSLQTLAGGLAHEIKNPLNYVTNSLLILRRDAERLLADRDGVDEDELTKMQVRAPRMFETAEAGLRRIAATVDLMLRYSRDGYASTLQPYDVYSAVKDALEVVVASSGFPVRTDVELVGDGAIECVPEELNQVLTNLVENAIHALPKDGTGLLTIRGHQSGSTLSLSIRDNGTGIAPHDLPRIFNAFYTTKGAQGTGLGLTIAHRVITSLGGDIRVKSQPGAGTELLVDVPVRAGAVQRDSSGSAAR